jgi:hypothetical protein
MILDETRERFLIAIAKQVDAERIAEIHFFAPIRQGGVESGVAVIAAARTVEAAAEASPIEESPAEEAPIEESPAEEAPIEESPAEEGSVVAPIDEAPGADAAESPSLAGSESSEALPSEENDPEPDDSTPSELPQDANIAPQDDDRADASAPIERHVIYTARYRLTLKGPDRGKWETNVTAEADAPIITVDAVVRGVQRRAGDVDDPTRMTGDEVRAALPST